MVSDTDIPRHPHRRGVSTFVLTMLAAFGVAACERANDQQADTRHPQQAGQPVNPFAMAGHMTAARVDLVSGDSRAAQKHIQAMASDITRSARMPDVSRPIDHEAARAAVRPLAGVRTSLWLDRSNFVVMVGDQQHRSMAMIDEVCLHLRLNSHLGC